MNVPSSPAPQRKLFQFLFLFVMIGFVGFSLIAQVQPAKAAVVFSNYPYDAHAVTGVYNDDLLAMGFAVPAGSNYTLNSIKVRLDGANSADVAVIQITSDSGGNPGSVLWSTNVTLSTTPFTGIDYTLPVNITIAAGQTYWITEGNGPSIINVGWGISSASPTGVFTWPGSRNRLSGTWSNAGYSFFTEIDASPITTPSWSFSGVKRSGCLAGQSYLTTQLANLTPGHVYYMDATVFHDGAYFMTQHSQVTMSVSGGTVYENLKDINNLSLSPKVAFPLPSGSPVTVTITLRDSDGVTQLAQASENYTCNTGAIS